MISIVADPVDWIVYFNTLIMLSLYSYLILWSWTWQGDDC